MKVVYILYKGNFGSSGYVYNVFRLKKNAKDAIKGCKNKYTYNKHDDLYENFEKSTWFRIDKHKFVD